MKQKAKSSIFCILLMAVTAGIFLLLSQSYFNLPMCWYTLGIILLSEAVLSGLYIFSKDNPKNTGVTIASLIQTVLNILVSIMVLVHAPQAFVGYTIFVILSFFALVAVYFFINRASASDDVLKTTKNRFAECRILVNTAKNSANGSRFYEELTQLEENIRFINDGVWLTSDEAIILAVRELVADIDNGIPDISVQVNHINALLTKHDFFLKTNR